MENVNFGLLESLRNATPTPIDSMNQAAKTDLARAQTNYANTQSQTSQQDLAIKKLSTINQLAGSIVMNPTQENLMATKKMAASAGIDASAIPDDINAAMPYIKNAYISSGQYLEQLKAQAQIEMARATLGVQSANANANVARTNIEAQDKGIAAPGQNIVAPVGSPMGNSPIQGFPSLGIGLNTGGGQPSAGATPTNQNSSTPMQGEAPTSAQPMPSAAQTNAQSMPTAGQAQPKLQTQYPGLANVSSNIIFPAQRAAQEEQAKDWAELGKGVAGGAASYPQIKNYLANIEDANNKRSFGSTAGLLPDSFLKNVPPEGQRLSKETDNLYVEEMKGFGGLGLGKLDLPIYTASRSALPEVGKYAQTNAAIIQQKRAQNEIRGNIAPVIYQTLNAAGIKDPVVFRNILNQVIDKTGAYNANGTIDANKLNNWQKYFYDILDPRTGVNPANGHQYSYGDFYVAAKKQNPKISDDEINQTWQTQLLNNSASAQNKPMPQPGNVNTGAQPSNQNQPTDQRMALAQQHAPLLAEAIAKGIESGGDYNAVGQPTRNGDRAYGKYQIMGSNIPTWTKEVFGRPMTPKEFLANPQAQDAVARAKLSQYIYQTGSLEDAASMWFSGKPARNNNRRDVNGTTVPRYVGAVGNTYARMG